MKRLRPYHWSSQYLWEHDNLRRSERDKESRALSNERELNTIAKKDNQWKESEIHLRFSPRWQWITAECQLKIELSWGELRAEWAVELRLEIEWSSDMEREKRFEWGKRFWRKMRRRLEALVLEEDWEGTGSSFRLGSIRFWWDEQLSLMRLG